MKIFGRIILLILLAIGVYTGLIFYKNTKLDQAISALKSRQYAQTISSLSAIRYFPDPHISKTFADLYAFGLGVERNRQKALKYLERSASKEKNDSRVCSSYGEQAEWIAVEFALGNRAPFDENEMLFWLKQSADSGCGSAVQILMSENVRARLEALGKR